MWTVSCKPPSVCLQADGQNHIDKVFFPLGRQDDAGGHAGGELQAQAVRWRRLQGVHQIFVVKSDLQFLSISGDGTLVGGVSDPRFGGDGHQTVAEHTAQGTFQLFTDDEGDTVDRGQQGAGVTFHMNRIVPGNGVAVGQKFPLQPAADQHRVPGLEQDVAGG